MLDSQLRQIIRFVEASNRRRELNVLASRLAPWMLPVSIAILAAAVLLRNWVPTLFLAGLPLLPLAGSLGLGLWVWIRPLPTIQCAKRLDDWLGWRDQLSSALCFELRGKQDEFARLSVEQALARIRKFDTSRRIPLRFPASLKWAVTLLLLALSPAMMQSSEMIRNRWIPTLFGADLRQAANSQVPSGSDSDPALGVPAEPDEAGQESVPEDDSKATGPAEASADLDPEALAGASPANLPWLDSEANSQFPVNWDELKKFFRPSEESAPPGQVAVSIFNSVVGPVDPAKAVAAGIGRVGDSLPEAGPETRLETRGERLELAGLESRGATSEDADSPQWERNEPRIEYRRGWALKSAQPGGFQLRESLSHPVAPLDLVFVRRYFELIRPGLK